MPTVDDLELTIPAKLRAAALLFACAAPQGVLEFDRAGAQVIAVKAWKMTEEVAALSDDRVPHWLRLAIRPTLGELSLSCDYPEPLRARAELLELLARECERLEIL